MSIKNFSLYFISYILLGGYCIWIGYSYPIPAIELKQEDNKWMIDYISYPDWAAKYGLQVGDVVVTIGGLSISEEPTKYLSDPYIRDAKMMEVQIADSSFIEVPFHYEDLRAQWYLHIVIPMICFVLTLLTSTYLLRTKSKTAAIKLLIQFLFVVSLAYISSAASSRHNLFGSAINAFTMLSSFILLLKFIEHYYSFWGIQRPFNFYKRKLMVIPLLGLLTSIVAFIVPTTGQFDKYILMILVVLICSYIFIVFAITYWRTPNKQLQILFIGLLAPFIPFLVLYFIPELLFGQHVLSSEICSLFLFLLPLNVVLFHLTERLYDMQYYVTRIRYYLIIGTIFSFWVTGGIALFIELALHELVILFIFTNASTVILFYLKEFLDYRNRKVLFSPHGNYMHQLYHTIQLLGSVYKIEEIVQVLQQEVERHLEIKDSFVLTYDYDAKAFDGLASLPTLQVETLLQMTSGTIIQNDYYYITAIHEDSHYKRWLFMQHRQSIRLKPEELLWLELIVSYTSVFIENTKIIEELLEELQSLRQERLGEPIWMKKLLWFKIEQEKFKLAQDLHDSILQENISIARQFDFVISDQKLTKISPQLGLLHEQMLNSIQQLRTYCETLKPPLLYQLGIHVALERLAEKIQSKTDFTLRTTFDRLYIENEQVLLSIYRIVQELLNNAAKHSEASEVEVSVLETEDGIEIYYTDDGIGCDIHVYDQSESFGIYGIQERVHALNGQITVNSKPNAGFTMQILIKEREYSYDYSLNH